MKADTLRSAGSRRPRRTGAPCTCGCADRHTCRWAGARYTVLRRTGSEACTVLQVNTARRCSSARRCRSIRPPRDSCRHGACRRRRPGARSRCRTSCRRSRRPARRSPDMPPAAARRRRRSCRNSPPGSRRIRRQHNRRRCCTPGRLDHRRRADTRRPHCAAACARTCARVVRPAAWA